MENRRKFSRFYTQMKAQYVLKGEKGDGGECTVVDISRKGMGIKFRTSEKIKAGTTIIFEIFISGELEPISVKGTVKWSKQGGEYFVGGIRLTEGVHKLTKLY